MQKNSLIITIINEEKTIEIFLQSVVFQTVLPDELIIVDGGSDDNTEEILRQFIQSHTSNIGLKFFKKKGNRSIGRNEAISKAKGDIILITDAGCILDKNWVKNISKPFLDKSVDVVAGYYKAKTKTLFQKCLVPYVLVMPDKVNPENFLPATRSMAIRKTVWKKMGGFDERYSHNEDFVFARKLRDASKKIVFAKNAIVYWIPRNTFQEAYTMFRRFAFGDMESGIVRDKVLLLFARYILLLYLLFYLVVSKSQILALSLILFLGLYVIYSILKNYRYVKDLSALYLLPALQILSDIAVMHGSLMGVVKRISQSLTMKLFREHVLTLSMVFIYLLITLPLMRWGVPNLTHPFFYHMDEWHGMQSIRYLFSTGSSNVEGAAYGMLFFYFLSGLFLVPFTLIGYLNPFAIKSSVGNLSMQERVASILRLSSILWGVGSIVLIAKIIKSQIKGNLFLPLFLFTINPIWLTLSTYFKYDIAVVFWILLSIFFFFKYENNPSPRNLVISSIISALTVTIKISALPILGMFVLSFLLFTPRPLAKLKLFGVCLAISFFVILIFGMPDIRTHLVDYYNLLHLNIVTLQNEGHIYRIPGSVGSYLAFKQYPTIFGSFLYLLSILSFLGIITAIIISYFKKRIILRKELFLVLSALLFIGSLVTLQGLGAGSNRALVLLPFMILFVALGQKYLSRVQSSVFKKIFLILIILGICLQLAQTIAWMSIKYQEDPRSSSSKWMVKEIDAKTEIGIENIPIYQMLPDLVVKEFYGQEDSRRYAYEVIHASSTTLPPVIILSSDDSIQEVAKTSPKIDLVDRLRRGGYKKIKTFSVNFYLYNVISDKRDFVFANLIPMPTSISIYTKR